MRKNETLDLKLVPRKMSLPLTKFLSEYESIKFQGRPLILTLVYPSLGVSSGCTRFDST